MSPIMSVSRGMPWWWPARSMALALGRPAKAWAKGVRTWATLVAKPPREGWLKKWNPRGCEGVFENTRMKPPANSYAHLVMRVELIVRNARNPHIVSNFIRLASYSRTLQNSSVASGPQTASESTSVLALSLASFTPICASDDSFPFNRVTLFNAALNDVVLTDRHLSVQWQRHLRSWRRWAQSPHVLLQPFVLVLQRLVLLVEIDWLQHVGCWC